MSKDTDNTNGNVVQLDEGVRQSILKVMQELGVTQSDIVNETGLKRQAVSSFLKGTFDRVGKRDKVKLAEWLRSQSEDQPDEPGDQPEPEPETVEPDFVQTVTATRVLNTLAYCHSEGDLGCIYGGPGVGKTFSVSKYQSEYPQAVFIMTASPEVATVHPMLEELARCLGLEDCAGGSRAISRAARDRLKAVKKPLVIIDEAQHLNLNALESLRSIHDETRCGMVLCGNSSVYERLTGGSRAAHFAQLFSRMGMQLHLRRPARQDVVELVNAWGITDERALDMLLAIAKRPGALRAVTKVIRLAVSAADGRPTGVHPEHIRLAATNLGLQVAT